MSSYDFKELEPYIVGSYVVSDYFSFVIYADKAPKENDTILINGNAFKVDSITDVTDDDEREQGLRYSKVWLCT